MRMAKASQQRLSDIVAATKCQELAALDRSMGDQFALCIYCVDLEHILCEIHTDSDDGLHGTTPDE